MTTVCKRPTLTRFQYYKDDKTLGQALFETYEEYNTACEFGMCANPNSKHRHYFYHLDGFVEMRSMPNPNPFQDPNEENAFLSIMCITCDKYHVLRKTVPKDSLEYSFGMYLKHFFYSKDLMVLNKAGNCCQHKLNTEMIQVFEIGNVQIVFKYVKSIKLELDLYDLRTMDNSQVHCEMKEV